MSVLVALSIAAVAALALLLSHLRRVDARRLETFRNLAEASIGVSQGEPRKPDMTFAGKGFMHVMIVRLTLPECDLEAQAMGEGRRLLEEEGASMSQALSAQWGGLCAINADPALYQDALDAYSATVRETGRNPMAETLGGGARLISAGMVLIGTQLALHPDEFERFLRHVGH